MSAPDPTLVLSTINAYQRSAALVGAIELGLFTEIARGKTTAAEIAAACSADARGVRILCDYLVVEGFLTKQSDQYGLSPTAATFLSADSPQYMGTLVGFLHSPHLKNAFEDIAAVVKNGGTLQGEGTTETEFAGWVEFARCMAPLMTPAAMFMAEWVAQQKPNAATILDIAAGHGVFGIEILKKLPSAQVIALDWPNVLAVAKENATAAGVADRHTLLPGDALAIDYPTEIDVVLLTNFLHHFDRSTCIGVLEKIAGSLSEDGLVLTLEFIPNEDRVTPPQSAGFAFTMLASTPKGDAYTLAEYESMFREVGMNNHRLLDVPHSPNRLLVSQR